MKLLHILDQYNPAMLEHISSDKVDEVINLKLPQPFIIQEIISALSSQSYISNKILYGRPPTFAILNLMLQFPDYIAQVEGFQAKVLQYVKELSDRATQNKTPHEKNAYLYVKILKKAWETDGLIDKSEGGILELVRHELGISDREHFILMHDASILNLWDIDQEYYQVRNHLLSHGILLTYENKYVIADEVAVQIRKAFGIEMKDGPFLRLLSSLTNEDLATALTYNQLTASGTKDVKVERLLHSLIPPSDILDLFNLEVLRELCRRKNIQHLGTKGVIIDNIIGFFDGDQDLQVNQIEEPATPSLPEPEVREMDPELYSKLLMNLTVQQLYDILSNGSFMTSGSKEDKVKRILSTYWSERTVFNQLRKEDLSQLCRKFALPVSGSKQELVDRILEYIPSAPVSDLHVVSGIDPIKDLSPQKESDQLHGNVRPSAELPEHYNEINAILPNLDHNEKIILAILKSSKSLNEVDLQRVAIKYGISWLLFKAHMALIMDKLKQANKTYIQIKSAQDNNIYQWDANGDRDNHMLEKKSARDIIDALRHGVVPRNNLDLVAVGQQAARSHLSEILMEINPHKSHFKFIRGPYGSGKTFLCSWLKNFALNHDFAVSLMNISHDQPLSDLPVFFAGMVNGLRTPEKTNASALVDILESWLLNIRNKLERIDGLNPDKAQDQQELNRIVKKSIEIELANLNDIEPGFPQALRSFYEGKVSGNTELVTEAVSWITGSKALSFQALKDIGVKGYLEANNVFPRMRALLKIIMGSGYRGLLLLVDELELVRRFPHARQREQALETLRLLIDESGRNALPGSLIIFTGTDEFFEDERNGLKSYEALSERVMTPVTQEDFVSMRQPIISLESLDRERLAKVFLKVRELYGIAYNCDACQFADDDSIRKLIDDWTMSGQEEIERKPRPVLRKFIHLLDLCEENKGVNLSHFIESQEPEMLGESIFNPN